MYTARSDAHQRQVFHALVALQNLMRHTGQSPGDIAGIHNQPQTLFVNVHWRSTR
jgi:hypothetical protein